MRPKLTSAILLVLFTTACTFQLPRLVFDTPTPAATAGPPPTPFPSSLVTFNVRVPSNTPGGSAPAVALLDPIGGTRTTIILTNSGNNLWTGGIQATNGAVLRYKYIRPLPALVEETTVVGLDVEARFVVVSGENTIAEDTVAAWDDVLFSGDTGSLEGRVWNANTTSGVMGALVAVGGQIAITDRDGSFFVYGLPTGAQRVTAMAPDGSLVPVQQAANITANQGTTIDLVSADPNAVHITFLVRPPAGADSSAILRMVGDVWQLGDDFVFGANGSSITSARAPTLVPLADGRWTVRLELFAGSILRYKYTLGDGVWNGELDGNGKPRVRTLIVPAADTLIDDTITTWRPANAASITLEALTPADTPGNDLVSIQLRPGSEWQSPLPMWRVGPNDWRFVIYNPTDFSSSIYYRYCRNYACSTADDATTAGPAASGRFFTPALFGQNLRDNVNTWQWLGSVSGGSGALPAIPSHAPFDTGYDLDDTWDPTLTPILSQSLDAMRAAGAGWVNITRRTALLPSAGPVPGFGEQLGLAPLPIAWNEFTSVAHNVGLRVSLHPVTCHYTPFGACDYWTGANFSAAFWDTWFANYERYLLTQAEMARVSGADQLIIGDFKLRPSFPGEPEAPADAEARWRGLIAHVREVYRGQIGFELLMSANIWPTPPAFLDAVDVIRVWWWSPLAEINNASVPDMALTAAALLETQIAPLQRFNRPVILSAAYLAVDGAATQCPRQPDGQCYSYEAFGPAAPDISAYGLDLQEQADAYTALLLAVNDRPWVKGLFSFGYHPQAILRDKSVSIRGKPAETVLSAWWPRLQGK